MRFGYRSPVFSPEDRIVTLGYSHLTLRACSSVNCFHISQHLTFKSVTSLESSLFSFSNSMTLLLRTIPSSVNLLTHNGQLSNFFPVGVYIFIPRHLVQCPYHTQNLLHLPCNTPLLH